MQAPNLKHKQEKISFLVIYLPLKLAQLLRLRSLVIIGQTWQRGALCVAHTVSFFFFHSYKKMSLLVEALSQIATARTTATIDNNNTHNQESRNTRETRMGCLNMQSISQDFVERK